MVILGLSPTYFDVAAMIRIKAASPLRNRIRFITFGLCPLYDITRAFLANVFFGVSNTITEWLFPVTVIANGFLITIYARLKGQGD